MKHLKEIIRNIPGFPKEGIVFRDITPLLADPEEFGAVVDAMADHFRGKVDVVVAAESRGFILGAPVALQLGVAFVPVRKPGKLPYETAGETYELEYGTDSLEIHRDAVEPGDRVLVVDDLLATGGTALACARLVEKLGGAVAGMAFMIELSFLGGRRKLEGYDVFALIDYQAE